MGVDAVPRGEDALARDGASTSGRARTGAIDRTMLTTLALGGLAFVAAGGATMGAARAAEARAGGARATAALGGVRQRGGSGLGDTWFDANGKNQKGSAEDDGYVTKDKMREFSERPWSWDSTVSCEGTEVTPTIFDFDAVEPARVKLWRNSSFAFNFWRTPRSRHYQIYDMMNVRNAFCKAGQYKVNIVMAMDSSDSCDWARKHYDLAGRLYPKPEEQHLGEGTFYCFQMRLENMDFKMLDVCGARATIEFNRLSNLNSAVYSAKWAAKIRYKYAWYVDPEDFEPGLIHRRLFSPEMDAAFKTERLLRVECYKDGDVVRSNNCQEGTMMAPRRVFNMRVFGGTVEAIEKMRLGFGYFASLLVPMKHSIQDWTINKDGVVQFKKFPNGLGCVCPSDEEVLTQWAHSKGWTADHLAFEKNVLADAATPHANEYGTCNWVDFKSGRGTLLD